MKNSCLLLAFALFSPAVSGQDATVSGRTTRVALKLAPLSLLDLTPTAQGAVEVWLRHQSVQAEFSYGRDWLGFDPNVNGMRVWRTRVESRYYTSFFSERHRSGTYVAIEGLYKQVNVADLDTIIAYRNSVLDPVFVYAPVKRHVYALHSKIGTQLLLGRYSESVLSRLIIDLYAGLGVRYASVVGNGAETALLFRDEAVYRRFAYSSYRPGDASWRLSLSAGLKVGLSL